MHLVETNQKQKQHSLNAIVLFLINVFNWYEIPFKADYGANWPRDKTCAQSHH